MGYLYIFLTIACTVYAQMIIKFAVSKVAFPDGGMQLVWFILKFSLSPLVLSGYISALLASFAWVAALSKFELSYAYPFMSLNFVFVVVVATLAFGESLNTFKLVGLGLIVGGVFCLGLSSRI